MLNEILAEDQLPEADLRTRIYNVNCEMKDKITWTLDIYIAILVLCHLATQESSGSIIAIILKKHTRKLAHTKYIYNTLTNI